MKHIQTKIAIDLKTKIHRNKKLIFRFVDNMLYVFDEKKMTLYTYNKVASFIWQNVKSTTTVETLVRNTTSSYSVEAKTAEKDIIHFIESEIGDNKLFAIDNQK